MIPAKKSLSPQFAVFYFKSKKSGQEQLRFVPLCAGCKKVIFDQPECRHRLSRRLEACEGRWSGE
jgi:hypothetical protein